MCIRETDWDIQQIFPAIRPARGCTLIASNKKINRDVTVALKA
jgi:hypothetical protein